MTTCKECETVYATEWEARYCARQDLDPRKENERFRSGAQTEPVLPITTPPLRS